LKKDPLIASLLLVLVKPETASDQMGTWKWVRSRLRQLNQHLAHVGDAVSAPTIGWLPKAHNYALRVNIKEIEAGSQHPERDVQF
jgi:hypothetical protein